MQHSKNMGVYIEITGTYGCPRCGRPLAEWQCKQLVYDGYPLDILMQRYKLNKKMSGEMHNVCPKCGPVAYKITKGKL
jgi:ribosomal protein L37E